MAKLPKGHESLYFDALCRTQKKETVLSLIKATYNAKKYYESEENIKNDIAKRLEYAYGLFKKEVGTYNGEYASFQSQYTVGHEMAIWKNSELDLTDLAFEVAEDKITIQDYFDIIFLNYIQPVNNIAVHPLYSILKYMKEHNIKTFEKEMTQDALAVSCEDRGSINGLFNFLGDTSYFDFIDNKLKLVENINIDKLISKCNIKYIGEDGYQKALVELDDNEEYEKYISNRNEKLDCISLEERKKGGCNIIYYGVPGTGKSYEIDKLLKDVDESDKIRITFHPDYTYNDFVGQLLPTVIKDGENKGDVTYKFQKGPFTEALRRAYWNPDKKVYLIIEEMSRGNCAAIFGDIFQLLDRNIEGESEYAIYNEVIANYLPDFEKEKGIVKIPSNFYIYGTVNTSDQNVFVMDTAFKRRFEWKYISTKPKSEINNIELELNNGENLIKIKWVNFYTSLNKFISSSEKLGLGEDKQIGQFFIKFDENDYKEKIRDKLLHYLWFDVQESSYKSEIRLFSNKVTCFSDLYEMYDNNEKIFSDEFLYSINNQ